MTERIIVVSRLAGNGAETQLGKDGAGKSQKKSLSFLTAQKMVKRLLACDRIVTMEVRRKGFTTQELAEKLSVNLSEVELFIKPTSKKAFYKKASERIALPLIKLYCSTKLVED